MDSEKDGEILFRLFTGAGQPELLAASLAMGRLFQSVRQIAPDLGTTLIEGETGTGKRLVARALHVLSPRRGGPFVAVNLKEICPTLLESALFGHVPGAFTGALAESVGLVQRAEGGTLFLDEIPRADYATQMKILRLVEEREFRRLGESVDRKVDIAVIAASNTDLWAEVVAARFLQDLYFRLKADLLTIPPLRDRTEDIRPLLSYYVREHARRTNRPVPEMSEDVWRLLLGHRWPGNVRELENSVRGIFSSARSGAVDRAALECYLRPGPRGGERKSSRAPQDPRILATLEALRQSGGKRAPAARALGISRQALYKRIERWRLLGFLEPIGRVST